MNPLPLSLIAPHQDRQTLEFISYFLQLNPSTRITTSAAIAHAYLQSLSPLPCTYDQLIHYKYSGKDGKENEKKSKNRDICTVDSYLEEVNKILGRK
jgi:serine/threonine protein kinase